MRLRVIYSIIMMTLLLVCRKDTPKDWKKAVNSTRETRIVENTSPERFYDSLITLLDSLQNQAFADQKSIEPLLYHAFDSSGNCFYSVGKGTINYSFPQEAHLASRKTSAKINGEYWGIYLKAWHNNKKIGTGKTLSGQILYSRQLFQKLKSDTLFMLLEIPFGSIQLNYNF